MRRVRRRGHTVRGGPGCQAAPARRRAGGNSPWSGWSEHPFDESGRFTLELPAGCVFEMCTEKAPSDAMRDTFWMYAETREFPTAPGTLSVRLPQRTRMRLSEGTSPYGTDVVTIYDETTKAAAWAVNDPVKALYTGYARGSDTDAFQRYAVNRPFETAEFRPGTYVVAAHVNARQWWAQRMTLEPGGTVELPTGEQPAGGGTIVCENGDALLLLHREFPIPMPYRRTDFRLRAQWDGVPPGPHRVRYPDGTEVDVTVDDGGRVELPKTPSR